MKALTIWQPWATLIMAGAKPYEFRRRPAPSWMIGRRFVVHAGTRPVKIDEVHDIFARIDEGESALNVELALPILIRLRDAHRSLARHNAARILPLAAGLGTAIMGTPVLAAELFRDKVADSSRLDESMWAWPLTDIERFEPVVPVRGAQGFWAWPFSDGG
jgi:hypothetical protein